MNHKYEKPSFLVQSSLQRYTNNICFRKLNVLQMEHGHPLVVSLTAPIVAKRVTR